MASKPPALAACVAGGALGLALAIADYHHLVRVALDLALPFDETPPVPRPTSMGWLTALKPAARVLGLLERPLISLTLALLLLAFVLLGAVLAPRFRVFLPAEETGKGGALAHLDTSRLPRLAGALLLSLWLTGAIAPLASFAMGVRSRPAQVLAVAAGGVPRWLSGLPDAIGPLATSLVILLALWLLWGPGGLAAPEGPVDRRGLLRWGLLAGLAAGPAVLALYTGRPALLDAGSAFGLADRAGWLQLFRIGVLVPVIAGAYLGLLATLYRPRSGRVAPGLWILSMAAAAGTVGGARWIRTHLRDLGVGVPGLAQYLHLPMSQLQRYALVLTPRGRAVYSITPDDTDDLQGGDLIAANGKTEDRVEEFLASHVYRSKLVFRAYVHLHDCRALNWETNRTLRADLELFERAPSRAAASLMLQKLLTCDVTPGNRAILDAFADPKRFRWPQPFGNRWLGMAYRHFGDRERSVAYFRAADLKPDEFGMVVGGIAPLTDGTVRGEARVNGKIVEGLRFGLVPVEQWMAFRGYVRPGVWGSVAASAHTDRSGVFQFRNIPEGRYVLVVTGGDIGRMGQAVVDRPPGMLMLDRFRSSITLPRFDIRSAQPLKAPGSGSTTVLRPIRRAPLS